MEHLSDSLLRLPIYGAPNLSAHPAPLATQTLQSLSPAHGLYCQVLAPPRRSAAGQLRLFCLSSRHTSGGAVNLSAYKPLRHSTN